MQADKVAKAREAGYHLIESSDEFEIVDVTDANQLKQYSAPVLSPKVSTMCCLLFVGATWNQLAAHCVQLAAHRVQLAAHIRDCCLLQEKYNRWELEQQLNEKEQAKVERAAHNLHKLRQDITPRKLVQDAAPAPSKLTK